MYEPTRWIFWQYKTRTSVRTRIARWPKKCHRPISWILVHEPTLVHPFLCVCVFYVWWWHSNFPTHAHTYGCRRLLLMAACNNGWYIAWYTSSNSSGFFTGGFSLWPSFDSRARSLEEKLAPTWTGTRAKLRLLSLWWFYWWCNCRNWRRGFFFLLPLLTELMVNFYWINLSRESLN